MKNDCPCNGCKKRTSECHGKCVEYPKWAKKAKDRQKRPRGEAEADAVLMTQGQRKRKYHRKKGG